MPPNQYHNAIHVIDVVQSTHALAAAAGFNEFLEAEDKFVITFAALIHDFEHRGVSNDFLVKTADAWVTDAGELPPNEHHHFLASFALLEKTELNFLTSFDPTVLARVTAAVRGLVLATDMAKHKALTKASSLLPAKNILLGRPHFFA